MNSPLARQLSAAPPAPDEGGGFKLKAFFDGPMVASGFFITRFRGLKRGISMLIDAQWENEQLTLAIDAAFHDGVRERKTWRFRAIAPRVYEGTCDDVDGTAIVYPDGPYLRRDYFVRLNSGPYRGLSARVRDVIAPAGDGSVLVQGIVTKWGVRLGSSTLRLVKSRTRDGARDAAADAAV